MNRFSSIFIRRLQREPLFLALLIAFVPLWWLARPEPSELLTLVDAKTMGALMGLMILSKGLEDSGYLSRGATLLAGTLGTERMLAAALVIFSAGLSAIVTNDVALFIVVPLTLSLSKHTNIRVGRLVIFEALAVNAGSAISPIGNPQNLYLWQSAGVSAPEFVLAMAPLSLGLMALVLLLIPISFSNQRLTQAKEQGGFRANLNPSLFWLSLLLYIPFLLLTDFGFALQAAALVFALYLLVFRRVLLEVDWFLLAIFLFIFFDMGMLASLPPVVAAAEYIDVIPGGMLTASIVLSQFVSNVPAAIFLDSFTDDWRLLVWGVTVGGFGLAIGSLANLIALRLARIPSMWLEFHRFSVPLLLAGGALAWGLSMLL
jgi:Na+/H+ antiporter NhaD/arsenite permease-like protein